MALQFLYQRQTLTGFLHKDYRLKVQCFKKASGLLEKDFLVPVDNEDLGQVALRRDRRRFAHDLLGSSRPSGLGQDQGALEDPEDSSGRRFVEVRPLLVGL